MNLREWRQKSGLTASEAADKAGVAYSTWVAYENGSRRPRPSGARRIEELTGGEISAASLLDLDGRPVSRDVGETEAPFSNAPVNVSIPPDLAEMARKYGLDVEGLVADGGVPRLREAFKRAYIVRHKEAIDEINASARAHGTLSQRFGMI